MLATIQNLKLFCRLNQGPYAVGWQIEGCFWFSLCELPPSSQLPRFLRPLPIRPLFHFFFLFFFFFNYRSNLGHLSLYHVNLQSPCGELEAFSFVLTLYLQCLQRPPGGRGRVQETIGFGQEWEFLPRLQIRLESRCRCSGRHLWSFLRMQCSSPFPASLPSGCYCLTSVSLGKHSTWTSCP